MSEDKKYTIDPETGLPEVPEDYFWRLEDTTTYVNRCGDLGRYVEREVPILKLIQFATDQDYRTVPVRGTKWYNRLFVVGYRDEFYDIVKEKTVASKRFEGFLAEKGEEPSFAINVDTDKFWDGRVNYDVPVTKETIAWIAGMVWEGYLEVLDWEAQEAREKETEALRDKELRDQADKARDELYGDYPPKSVL